MKMGDKCVGRDNRTDPLESKCAANDPVAERQVHHRHRRLRRQQLWQKLPKREEYQGADNPRLS